VIDVLENARVIVDIDSCTKCKACSDECDYFYFKDDDLHFDKTMEELCIDCGKCVAVCPVDAIKLKVNQQDILESVPTKEEIPSFDSLAKLFKSRRSRRQFTDKPVPKELIEKILTIAGRYSPTGHNQENVHFTVVQDKEILKQISDESTKQVTNLINVFEDPEGRKTLEKSFPPGLIKRIEEVIPSFKLDIKKIKNGKEIWRRNTEIIVIHTPKNALTPIENCTLAACQIMLAAETLGLGTCSLGYLTYFFNEFRPVGKIIKLPLKHNVGYTLAIGFPKAHYYKIPERKPLKAKWF
jgi:nitroreductase/NAD-dependent dihydropyrimidine dehydrogenase PreA subunit